MQSLQCSFKNGYHQYMWFAYVVDRGVLAAELSGGGGHRTRRHPAQARDVQRGRQIHARAVKHWQNAWKM